jgi:hypothetical protein
MVSASPEVRSFGKELGQATRPVGTVVRHKRRTPRDDLFLDRRDKKRQSRRRGGVSSPLTDSVVSTPESRSWLLTKRLVLV